ncbi:MAG: hypothetical protein IMX02_09305 [Limnochordaceae bacterium]|nr:hypothetical protein [Limnochordaceae bacterium]
MAGLAYLYVPRSPADTPGLDRLWDALVQLGAVVEPDGAQGGFFELAGLDEGEEAIRRVTGTVARILPFRHAVGVAPTRLVAKAAALSLAEYASAAASPGSSPARAALRIVAGEEEARAFLEGLPLRLFWICPASVRETLTILGFHTVGEIARVGPDPLFSRFGLLGWQIWRWSQGIDPSRVFPAYPPPSIVRTLDLDPDGGAGPADRAAAIRAVRMWAADIAAIVERRRQVPSALGLRMTLELPRHLSRGAPEALVQESIRLGEGRYGRRALEDLAEQLLARVLRQAHPWLDRGATPRRLELIGTSLRPGQVRQDTLFDARRPSAVRQDRMADVVRLVNLRVGAGAIRIGDGDLEEPGLARREAMLALIEQGVGLA